MDVNNLKFTKYCSSVIAEGLGWKSQAGRVGVSCISNEPLSGLIKNGTGPIIIKTHILKNSAVDPLYGKGMT